MATPADPTPDHVLANRQQWTENAPFYEEVAERQWDTEPHWGLFSVPDARVGIFPDVAGLDVIELGCGTGYVGGWCLRAGARKVIGLDNSQAQLATARRMVERAGVEMPLVWGDAERPPFADASFDVAINEYGAAIWCDPYRWIPEAARLLRPNGRLVFIGNSLPLMLCAPDLEEDKTTTTMQRPQRGMHRFDWDDAVGVEFHLPHGDMIRLLRANEFEVVDLIDIYAEPGDETRYPYVDAEWASRWPVEEAWIARRLA